jgi:3-oxoadipate enol-lactonase
VVDEIHGPHRRLDSGWLYEDLACANIRGDVPKIACPTLVITTEGSGLASVDETQVWQQIIPNSELLVLPGNSYHEAATHTVECAQATLAFIERRALGD